MANLAPWKRKKTASPLKQRRADLSGWLFDEPFFPSFDPFNRSEWWPRVDVSEGRANITVEAEIPGMAKEDIDLSIEDRYLHIRGQKSREKEENDEGYYRVERAYGYFNRTIELPAPVDEKSVEAKYKRGVLKIKMKKQKDKSTRRIAIAEGSESKE
jgi:HSP20 family protein